MSSSDAGTSTDPSPRGGGRGRGKSRGGLGKYLRARGRGRGGGRPAEFHKRLVLEDEEVVELEPDSEEARELARKYATRQLGSNADRYVEPEPVLNSDGEEEQEPEVDLSSFLERQRLDDSDEPSSTLLIKKDTEDDDVDESLAHLIPSSSDAMRSHKGKIQSIEWTEELEEIRREKEIADANRDLKNRFKANTEKQKGRQARGGLPARANDRKKEKVLEAPPLPTEDIAPPKSEKGQMEDFLDDLLG
ncbi:uncharacterized protein FOMMEDRAFT_27289 [Fomitiporia mediterranea MF3/22]|uniref:uncharacterized protein n=1 Tax=Fomitiporia mediterranea (strain MF3/22) TaxID=694068 RepID=UPI00044086F5|nr:uncharacterized protein FOMMEDRAFT_27289 [Fomitiporia mediterranea MF3/22]EJD05036.1 hypothetical protein FOMMEDRAFT_27289 [Fomitiporia mediterranea MF3/22]